jgi:hypothetical protein
VRTNAKPEPSPRASKAGRRRRGRQRRAKAGPSEGGANLSGVFEQNYFTIAIGVVLMLGAWLSFYLSWRKQAKAGQLNHDKN